MWHQQTAQRGVSAFRKIKVYLLGLGLVGNMSGHQSPATSPFQEFGLRHSCHFDKHMCAIQDVALIDARRGANMFRKIKVPLLGLVENMSGYQCPACGHKEHIFGHEGGVRTAADMSMDVLGQVRLEVRSEHVECRSQCKSPHQVLKTLRYIVWA